MKIYIAVCHACIGIILLFLLPLSGHAQGLPDTNTYAMPLNSWQFTDTNWLSRARYSPVGFTNIVNIPNSGDGNALLVDSADPDVPAFLLYNVVETNGFTNIDCANGTISFWFNPDWSSTNQGGTGPGEWGNLISLGQWGTNGSSWWSLYLSPDGGTVFFASQTNGTYPTTYLSAPVSLIYSNWYNFVLTYTATNSAFYTNGVLVTSGTGVEYWPGPDVTFFAIGSDTNGYYQAAGQYDDLSTYNYAVQSSLIAETFGIYTIFYYPPAEMVELDNFNNAPSSPPTTAAPRWFTGSGEVQYVGAASGCATNVNVWLTNVSATTLTNGTTSITFTIAGGTNGSPYDVYGTTALYDHAATNSQWAWLGQGYSCNIYTITNLPYSAAFLILGTGKDSDGDGLTDAFEILVSKTSPTNAETYGSLPDAWVALNGLTGASNLANLDPDLDGLINYKEYLYGTKPLVSEGVGIWVGNPAGFSGIP